MKIQWAAVVSGRVLVASPSWKLVFSSAFCQLPSSLLPCLWDILCSPAEETITDGPCLYTALYRCQGESCEWG